MTIIKYLCSLFKATKFTNWSENIKNKNAKLFYPENDDDIRRIIKLAKQNNSKIRVTGTGHSQTPLVCDSDESIYLVSLKNYQLEPANINIDHDNLTVEVNAGWQLGQLYDKLSNYNYYLETHTAAPVFTIGGIVNNTIHGSRLGASLMSDSVIAITLIDANGDKITKTNEDKDFNLYTLSFGLFGIVTSVTFRILKLYMEAKIINYYNIFDPNNKVKRNILDDFFKDIINKCLNESIVVYNHSFIDYHNDALISLEWFSGNDSRSVINTKEINNVYKVMTLSTILENISKNYRTNNTILKSLGKVTRYEIEFGVEKNLQEDKDMFWVDFGTRSYFMSYFIPIHVEGTPINLDNLYMAIEAVTSEVKKTNKHFNIDLPCDIRFVCSSKNSILSPIYTTDKKIVYASIDILNMANNLHLNDKESYFNGELNRDFRQFYHNVEQKWIALGGVPHLAKVFGFGGTDNKPFDKTIVTNIYGTDTKEIVRNKMQPLFVNNFLSELFD